MNVITRLSQLLLIACASLIAACGAHAMNSLEKAFADLSAAKTAAEEKTAAEKASALAREKRTPLTVVIFDADTGKQVPVGDLDSDRKLRVQISAGSIKNYEWKPKASSSVFPLLRE